MSSLFNPGQIECQLAEAAQEVLETMFFCGLSEDAGQAEAGNKEPDVAAIVRFHGAEEGALEIRLSEAMAMRCASDFFGEEESETRESDSLDVVREMANMVCGNLLSRLERNSIFCLDEPVARLGREPEAARESQEIGSGLPWIAKQMQFEAGAVEIRFFAEGMRGDAG